MSSGGSARPFDLASESRDAIARFLARAALAAGPAVMEEYRRARRGARQGGRHPRDRRRRTGRSDHPRAAAPVGEADRRSSPRRRRRRARRSKSPNASSWSIPSTEPGNSSPATANSPSISRSSKAAFPSPARFTLRRWSVCGSAARPPLPARRRSAPACRTPRRGGRLRARPAPASLVALASRSHGDPATEAFLARLPIGERRSAGSSLKFCLIAEGEGDVYPRFAPDDGMGHRGGRRGASRRRRRRARGRGRAARLWQDRGGTAQRRLSSPGATRVWRRASPIVNDGVNPPRR